MTDPVADGPGEVSRRTALSLVAILAAAGIAFDAVFDNKAVYANGPWGGYSNGYIPLNALVQIDYPGVIPYQYSSDALPHVYMAPGASENLLGLLAAYHAAAGGYLRVSEGYRTYAGQVWLEEHDNGGPAGTSNHGWGKAVDFDSGIITQPQVTWLAANGPTWGFSPLSGDLGHYNYSGPISAPTPTEGDDMAVLFNVNNVYLWALAGLGQGEAGWLETTDSALAAKYNTASGRPTISITQAQFDDIKAKFVAQY
jgi:hypothetical protein